MINISNNLVTEFKKKGLIGGFELKMYLEGEHIHGNNNEDLVINDEQRVPEGVVDYFIDWHGNTGAPLILDLLEGVFDYHGIQRVIDKRIYMRRAFVSLENASQALPDIKEANPYLIVN